MDFRLTQFWPFSFPNHMFASYPDAPHSSAVGDLFLIENFADSQAHLGLDMHLAGSVLL